MAFFVLHSNKLEGARFMELMQLEMFVAVIEERSVQKAADRVSRTQPAVSIALRKLEDHVGITLLDRSRRRDYRLTQAGELLYEFASAMLAMRNEVISALRGKAPGCTGRLSIGVSGPSSLRSVPVLTTKFCERHPLVRVEIMSDQPEKLLGDLADRRIDVAFLSTHPKDDRLKAGVVLTPLSIFKSDESLWLALPRAGRSHTLKMFEQMVSSQTSITMRAVRRPRRFAREAAG
jgi:DNA-binding transcriptional LysR family regulator